MATGTKSKETVLITGASAGIGEALALIFAEKGYDLILVARRQDRLEALAADLNERFGAYCQIFQKDLSRPEAALELSHDLLKKNLTVDILINNAGAGVYGEFSRTSREQEAAMLQLNVVSLTNLTKLLLPGMIERKKGRILNVASTAAFQPGPYMAVYYASKAFVVSFSEALAHELKNSGVRVSVLCPGPTATEFQKAAGIDSTVKLFKFFAMPADKVAKAGYQGLIKGKKIIIPGIVNQLSAFFGRFSPHGLVLPVVEFIQKSTHLKRRVV